MIKPISQKKITKNCDINQWWMVYGKIAKGLPPLRRPKLRKKSQEKEDDIERTI